MLPLAYLISPFLHSFDFSLSGKKKRLQNVFAAESDIKAAFQNPLPAVQKASCTPDKNVKGPRHKMRRIDFYFQAEKYLSWYKGKTLMM